MHTCLYICQVALIEPLEIGAYCKILKLHVMPEWGNPLTGKTNREM